MEPDDQEPEHQRADGDGLDDPDTLPQVHNVLSGQVGGDALMAHTLHVHRTILTIQGMPKREPTRPEHFAPAPALALVNQKSTLATLTEYVTDPAADSTVVALRGPGGVGKTAVAAHWSRQVAEDLFPDGVMHIDLERDRAAGGTGMTTILAALLLQCGWQSWELAKDLPGLHAQFQAHVRGKRVLVVVDHAQNEAEVRPLRPVSPGSTLLITGHSGGRYATDQRDLTVEPLDDDAAVELVRRTIGDRKANAEPTEVAELVRLLGGVPKVIDIALTPVRLHEGITVADVLANLREDLERAPRSREVGDMLEIVADREYRSLSEPAARLYRRLGALPCVDYSKDAILAVAAALDGSGLSMFVELLDRHLLTRNGNGRYELSRLVRAHARQRARAEDDAEAERETVKVLAAWYAGWAYCADTAVIPFRTRVYSTAATARPPFGDDADVARDWFESERHNLIAIQRYCAAQGVSDRRWLSLVLRLAESMWVVYLGGRYLEDWRESSELGVAAAVDAGDGAAEVRFRTFLARVWMELEEWDKAEAELARARALPMIGDLGPDLRASAYEFTGRLCGYQGDHQEAVKWYRKAMALFAEQAERADLPEAARAASARGVALQLQFIGRCLLRLGELPEALGHLRQAETRMLDIGHDRDAATIRTELGEALRRLGRIDEAFVSVAAAVEVLADKKWYRIETNALWELSLIAEIRGETELERTCLRRLRQVYSVTANPRLESVETRLARLPEG